ncbi:hypothetical protein [Leptolyngbya sp. PCC 6406]|uniref:hypothetical protein n=1 Tax=Leptolyngbya sp. PCC 6406 TaxID=1173264 RepID=UPI0002AD138F|nr:hypothetical protein [Leptolyngbya sp. PCC 6406]
MDNLFRYWQLVRLTGAGKCQRQVIAPVETWLKTTLIPELTADALEEKLQQVLLHRWRTGQSDGDLAQLSLRCFVTHQIRGVCLRLAQKFGEGYGFRATDLFYLVLDDDGQPMPQHRPLTLDILDTYDPSQSALTTWSSRLTNNHRGLNQALLEKGLYRVSDWAILNDTRPEQIQRILGQYHLCSQPEVDQATDLLNRYQQVYRRDRIVQRQSGKTGRCLPPTPTQLAAINPDLSAKVVLQHLQQLATYLRQYRIHVRGGSPQIYQPEDPDWEQQEQAPNDTSTNPEEDDQDQFLQVYRQALDQCLADAIAQVLQANITRLRSRTPPQDRAYIQGLYLRQCLGLPMGKLAPQIGLSSQVQVTRLLNLKRLRSDVRHRLIPPLYETVRHQALPYVSADRLKAIDHRLEDLLTQEVDRMIADAAAEAQAPKGRLDQSLFSHQLCQTIHPFMPDISS